VSPSPVPAAAPPACAVGMFRAAVARRPDATAVIADDRRLTFAELDAASGQLAAAMRGIGAGPEQVVGLCLERGAALITAMLAAWKAGSGFVLADPAHPAGRSTRLLARAAATVIAEDPVLGQCAASGIRCVPLADLVAASASPPGACCAGSNIAYIIFTSGSTGQPKGVMVEHRAVAEHAARRLATLLDGQPDTPLVVAGTAPLSVDVFISQFLAMACLGHTLVVLSDSARLNPWTFHPATSPYPPFDVLDGAPAQVEALVQCGMLEWPRPPRIVLMGGEAPSRALWSALAQRRGTVSYNLYGATECTIDSAVARARPPGDVTIGRPYGGSTLYVLDGQLNPVQPGQPGDLYLGGTGVSRGYLGQPRLTADNFLPDPFRGVPGARMYRTGDRGRLRPDGDFEFLGRRDDQVKIRGHRIECGEVEAALQEHPLVTGAVAAALPQPSGTEMFAFVTLTPAAGAGAAARVREQLARTLPAYLLPHRIVVVPQLPLSPAGKVDRRLLVGLVSRSRADQGTPGPGSTPWPATSEMTVISHD
jgi:amino acid adenylation domain-containing protein